MKEMMPSAQLSRSGLTQQHLLLIRRLGREGIKCLRCNMVKEDLGRILSTRQNTTVHEVHWRSELSGWGWITLPNRRGQHNTSAHILPADRLEDASHTRAAGWNPKEDVLQTLALQIKSEWLRACEMKKSCFVCCT